MPPRAMKTVLVGIVLFAAAAVGLAQSPVRRGTCPGVSVPKGPAVDGTGKDPIWAKSPELILGDVSTTGPDPKKLTTARVLFGPRRLYVVFKCADADTGQLKAAVAERDGNVWQDDCVELFVSGDLEAEGYFHFIFNAKGAVYDERCKGNQRDKDYKADVVAKAAVVKGVGWTVTASVALKDLGAWAGKDLTWRLNVTRTQPARGRQAMKDTSWATLGAENFHQPEAFGRITGVTIPKLADGVSRQRDPADDPSRFVPKAGPKDTRLKAVADVWLSDGEWEGVNERLTCMGKARHFKIKSIQEMAAIRFDASPAAGREVRKATLYMRRTGSDRLRYIRVSTIAQDWREGAGTKDYGPGDGACYGFADFKAKKPWAWPGSQFCDVIMTAGNTIACWAECKKLGNGWLSVDLSPALIDAMVCGDTDGLAVMDGGSIKFHNNFVHSVQSKGSEPFIFVELGKRLRAVPARPRVRVAPAPERSHIGSGAVKVAIAPAKNAFNWRLKLNGKPVARWRVHRPAAGKETVFYLEDLKPTQKVDIEVVAVARGGKASRAAKVSAKASAGLSDDLTLGKFDAPGRGAAPPEEKGKIRVWAVPPMIKIAPDKPKAMFDDIGVKGGDYTRSNAVWDGKAVSLCGARGEYVSYQLCVENLSDGPLKGIRVVAQPLNGPGGKTIGGTEIELFKNWYALNRNNAWQPAYCVPLAAGSAFQIPDPKRQGSVTATVRRRNKSDVKVESAFPRQQNQTVTVDVYVPKDAQAGKYAGSIMVRAEGAKGITLPVNLTVFDFALPDKLSFWPELNAYRSAPTAYYVLAHQHRCVLNAGPPAPRLSGKGKAIRAAWDAFDRKAGPLLDGTAFKNNRRAGVPVPVMYLPFSDSWPTSLSRTTYRYNGPWGGNMDIIDQHYLTAPYIADGLSQGYKDAFLAVQKQYVEHFKAKGWNATEMQCFYGGKATHRVEYNVNMWWTTDEPYHWADWLAVQFFNRLWTQGRKAIGADKAQWVARSDISRPNWQGRVLDGIIDTQYGAMGSPANNRRLRILHEDTGVKINDYGSANGDTTSNTQSVTVLLKVYLGGGGAHLPWQSLGSDSALDLGDLGAGGGNALLVPGKRFGLPVVGDARLKAFREGQQIIEYLTILGRRRGLKREQLNALVEKSMNIAFGFRPGASLENADAKLASTLKPWELTELRRRLAKLIVASGQRD